MEQPELTKLEYDYMSEVKTEVFRLKAERSNLFDNLRAIERNLLLTQSQFKEIQEKIDEKESEFQELVNSIGTKFGLQDKQFLISDEYPHVVKVV